MRRAAGLAAAALLVHTTAGAAEAPPPEPVTLHSLIEQVAQRSPEALGRRRAYEAARARVIAAWLPDDPEAGVDAEGQPGAFRISDRSNLEYMVAQTIPFPTTLVLRGQVALRDAQIAHARYQEAVRDAAWHLEQPYYELYLATKSLATLEELRSLLEKVSSAVQARYETNRTSQQDLLKARIELSKLDVEAFQVRQNARLAEAHLSHVLNRPLHTAYRLPEAPVRQPFEWSLAELERRAVDRRPELQASALGIRRAKTSRLLQQTGWLPAVTLRYETRRFENGAMPDEHDTFVGVTLPVWSLLKGASGEWVAAHRDVQEAEAAYLQMKNEVLLAVHEAFAKAAAADHALTVYEEVMLPQAKQQVEVALASYEAGRADFLELIDAQRMLKDVQLAYYKATADYETGLAGLRFAVGDDLEPPAGPGAQP